MPDIVYSTENGFKAREAAPIFRDLPAKVVDLNHLGRKQVTELGTTLHANARAKGAIIHNYRKGLVIGEDFGFFAVGLGGYPGVSPLRWSGKGRSLGKAERALLQKLAEKPEASRQATMKSVVVLFSPDGKEHEFEAELKGEISSRPETDIRSAYPFDRVFKPDGHDLVMALLPPDVRLEISPRGVALKKTRAFIDQHPHWFDL